jgi:cobalt-zinc-cadmium efflux system outer membrane protein
MNRRWTTTIAVGTLLIAASGSAQVTRTTVVGRFVDRINGLSLDQAIARALELEPSLRSARSAIDVAKGMRQQAALRPGPSASFERREEPAGTDNQTMVAVEWPLDLFRKAGRVTVADREVAAAEQSVADRERLLAAEVRMRYGEVLVAVRELAVLDELVSATRRQHELLRSRVAEGATPPLERDLVEIELRRVEADRLLQTGRTEAAVFALKRVLGIEPDAPFGVRDTLEGVVLSESAPRSDTSSDSDQRADVREAATRIGIADAKIDRAQREGRFDVSLFASYARMDAGFPQLGLSPTGVPERVHGIFHYVAGGARLTLPIFNRNQGEIATARAERAGAGAAYEAARLTAKAEVAAAAARDARAHEAVALYSSGLEALARQNLGVVGQSYELGRVSVFDVLAEQRRFLDVERAYTDALRTAYDARTDLRRAAGDVR